MANILMISYIFPPLNSTGCRRVYAWAKYLKRLGHKISILTADTPDDEKTKNLEFESSIFDVRRVKYPDPRRLIKRVFKLQGPISNEFAVSSKEQPMILLLDQILNLINRYFSSRGILFGATRMPAFSDLWLLAAYKRAKEIIREQDINVIITSSPPIVANLVAAALKKRFKHILWIQDIRDLWTQNPTHKGLFPFTIMEDILERSCINRSDVITVVSEVWKQWLQKKYPHKEEDLFLIENGYDRELGSGGVEEWRSADRLKKTIIHSGTLYKKRRDPQSLFEVVDKNSAYLKDKLEILFYGSYETRVILDEFFNKYPGTKGIIEYKGFLSDTEIMLQQNKAEALLLIERDKENDGTLPAKIFEYMAYKKPIICLGISPFSYIGNILEESGLAIFCGDDQSKIEANMRLMLKDNLQVSPQQDFISRFCREKQVKRLDEIIMRYLKS